MQLEPRIIYSTQEVPPLISCNESDLLNVTATSIRVNGTIYEISEDEKIKLNQETKDRCNTSDSSSDLFEIDTDYLDFSVLFKVNVSRVIVDGTALKNNPTYYNVYCIGINMVFASLLPFIALTYFNVSIALRLRARTVSIQYIFFLASIFKDVCIFPLP